MNWRRLPLVRGGVAAPFKKMSRYLIQGAAGEVRSLLQQRFDLPGRAEFKVALHLLDRRGQPLLEGGEWIFARFF
jgi:hypothetical protein